LGPACLETLRAVIDSFGREAMKLRDLPTVIASRQMSLLFDRNRLEGLEALERGKVASALAQILMQAAGIRVEELDDDEL
jgi:hypothetical protein